MRVEYRRLIPRHLNARLSPTLGAWEVPQNLQFYSVACTQRQDVHRCERLRLTAIGIETPTTVSRLQWEVDNGSSSSSYATAFRVTGCDPSKVALRAHRSRKAMNLRNDFLRPRMLQPTNAPKCPNAHGTPLASFMLCHRVAPLVGDNGVPVLRLARHKSYEYRSHDIGLHGVLPEKHSSVGRKCMSGGAGGPGSGPGPEEN